MADLLSKLSHPTTPDLTRSHGPTQGVPWAVPPMGHAPLGAGEGVDGAGPLVGSLLDPIRGYNKETLIL